MRREVIVTGDFLFALPCRGRIDLEVVWPWGAFPLDLQRLTRGRSTTRRSQRRVFRNRIFVRRFPHASWSPARLADAY